MSRISKLREAATPLPWYQHEEPSGKYDYELSRALVNNLPAIEELWRAARPKRVSKYIICECCGAFTRENDLDALEHDSQCPWLALREWFGEDTHE